jgi:hypothetical protein
MAGTIRQKIVQPRLRQPAPVEQKIEPITNISESLSFNLEGIPDKAVASHEPFGIGSDFNFATKTPEETVSDFNFATKTPEETVEADTVSNMRAAASHMQSPPLERESSDQAKVWHLSEVKRMENPKDEGLYSQPTGPDVFMPFESSEGTGPDKSMSKFEIGYGIKIPKKWLSGNIDNWPLIEGVRVDVSKGVTVDQAEWLSNNVLEATYKSSREALNKHWKSMSPKEKVFPLTLKESLIRQ